MIADRAFAWQGKYTIEVRSRVVGDYPTTSAPTAVAVIIDSVAPEARLERATLDDAGCSCRTAAGAPSAGALLLLGLAGLALRRSGHRYRGGLIE